MKIIKGLGQILASIIYTPIYTALMYLVIVFPLSWIMSLSFWKMLLAFIVLGGVIEFCIILLQTIGLLPYKWIVKDNKVALVLSILLCVVLPLFNVYALWNSLLGQGTFAVVVAIVLTAALLHFIFVSVSGILGFGAEK